MADTVASQTLFDGERVAIMKFTNISDGTGESAVTKVDVSALSSGTNGGACDGVTVTRITSVTAGMSIRFLWDATTDVMFFAVPETSGYQYDFTCFGGLINNAGAGKTGDIAFTTVGHTSGDTYTVVLEMTKHYA